MMTYTRHQRQHKPPPPNFLPLSLSPHTDFFLIIIILFLETMEQLVTTETKIILPRAASPQVLPKKRKAPFHCSSQGQIFSGTITPLHLNIRNMWHRVS